MTFTQQKLSFPTKDISQEGYLFVYLSYDNDSDNWVYFDDFKVTHTKTNVMQYNACPPKLQRRREYYSFGLQTANSWTREDKSNNYLYNGGSELNEHSGWYETFFRGYDAALGRFLQVDPLANMSSRHSPYSYAFNDPVLFNDPNGDYPREVEIWREQNGGGAAYNYDVDFFASGSGYYTNGAFINPNRPGAGALRSMELNAQAVTRGELSLSEYAQMYGSSVQWNHYGGDQITREEWLALGGDANKSADLYFSGGWEVAQQGNYRARMSPEELAIFDSMGKSEQFAYLYNGDYAISTAQHLFDAHTLHNGRGDAFRHALFSALNSRDLGLDLAKRLGDAHERHRWETPLGREMDLFNNDVGRQIFTILDQRGLAGHYSTEGFVISVIIALEGGFLREIGGSPPGLIPTR